MQSSPRQAAPQTPPKKKGMSGLMIALLVGATLLVVGAGSCITCGLFLSGSARSTSTTENANVLATTRKKYTGEWTGTGTTLSFSADGEVAFKSRTGATSTTYSGKLKGFEKDNVEITAGPIPISLKVQKAPFKDGDVWKMTMENVDLTRPDGPPPSPGVLGKVEQALLGVYKTKATASSGVTCKGTLDEQKTSTVECELSFTGGASPVAMLADVQTDGNIDSRSREGEALIDGTKINALFNSLEDSKKNGLKGGCQPAVYGQKVGATFTCPALKEGTPTGTVSIKVEDQKGRSTVHYEP